MPDLQRLVAAARAILPDGVAVAAADPRRLYPLLPGEGLPGAVPARLREFSAGRHAARLAMASLAQPVQAIAYGPDRAPVWPPGFAGTITHTRSVCLAAAGVGQAGLGLDIEDAPGLDPALWDSVLGADEVLWALRQPDPGHAALLVFSAKEAAYKAQYAVTGTLFGFETLSVRVQGSAFEAVFRRPIGAFAAGHVLRGRHAFAEGHILTAVVL